MLLQNRTEMIPIFVFSMWYQNNFQKISPKIRLLIWASCSPKGLEKSNDNIELKSFFSLYPWSTNLWRCKLIFERFNYLFSWFSCSKMTKVFAPKNSPKKELKVLSSTEFNSIKNENKSVLGYFWTRRNQAGPDLQAKACSGNDR